MKIEKKRKQRSLAEQSFTARLLLEIAEQLDPFVTFGNRPVAYLKYGMDGLLQMRKAREYKQRHQALARLEKQKFIAIDRRAKSLRIALTRQGKHEVFRLSVLKSDLFEDGRVCMVVFDIPERHRKIRKSLREFLSQAGFLPIQWSVWISPFNAGRALARLFAAHRVTSWVRIFNAKEISS